MLIEPVILYDAPRSDGMYFRFLDAIAGLQPRFYAVVSPPMLSGPACEAESLVERKAPALASDCDLAM